MRRSRERGRPLRTNRWRASLGGAGGGTRPYVRIVWFNIIASGARLGSVPASSTGRARTSVPPSTSGCLAARLGWLLLSHSLANFESHFSRALVGVNNNVVTVQYLAAENLQCKRILHQLLNGAFQRASAEVGVEAFGEEQLFRCVGQLDGNLALGQQAAHIFETKLDNLD